MQDGIDPSWSLTIDLQKAVYPVEVLTFSLVRFFCIKTKEMNINWWVKNKLTFTLVSIWRFWGNS